MSAVERPVQIEQNTQEPARTDSARPAAPSAFAPGDPVPNLEMWVLVRKLGGGGFGEVWLARHERRGEAAFKFCTDPAARHQLVNHEKTVVARVMKHGGHHPNVVPLLECNLTGEIPWLMYEFVEGGTLAEVVAEWRTLPLPRRLGRVVRTLHAITGALGQFHQLSPPIVHRDLKPQNILMAGRVPRITDFGIGGAATEAAKDKTGTGGELILAPLPMMLQHAGSSRYAPQEQFFGSPPHPRDDVFALGVLAYQLILADLEADPGPDAARVLLSMRIPADLVLLIARSMALDPERRPRDAKEWEARLAALLQKKTLTPRPASGSRPGESDDSTEPLPAISDLDIAAAALTQRLTVPARGRWYSRPAAKPDAEWVYAARTPGDVRVSPAEVYRFSLKSTATAKDVAALAVLAGVPGLQFLNLSFCAAVTDAGLAPLKGFPGLRHLYLRSCHHVTDAGLPHLRALTELLTLDLSDCPRLTDAGIAALREALPKCKVHH